MDHTRGYLLLVTGGARSGKSRYAEEIALKSGGAHVYVATAQAGDNEMADRITRHRKRRGHRWQTIEAPLDLATVLDGHACPGSTVLVDCLTLWLSNLLANDRDAEREIEGLVERFARTRGNVIVVTNEVGLGIVPDNPLARRFRDLAGFANQRVAAVANEVVFVACGLPLTLKRELAGDGS